MMVAVLPQALAPVTVTTLFAFSKTSKVLDGHLYWIALLCICMCIPELILEHWINAETQPRSHCWCFAQLYAKGVETNMEIEGKGLYMIAHSVPHMSELHGRRVRCTQGIV